MLMLLAAKLAVAEEVQQIRLKKQLQRQMPAMVKLSNNRTIACSTTNFPNVRLILSMPRDLCLAADVDVNVSIFHHFDEFVFQATVLSLENNVMSVEVDHESLDDYASFANLAFARDEDWPKWLPDQDADQLVPTWIFKVGNKVTLKLMALLHALSKRRVNP
jgi:cellulose synthase (UDP-forming)